MPITTAVAALAFAAAAFSVALTQGPGEIRGAAIAGPDNAVLYTWGPSGLLEWDLLREGPGGRARQKPRQVSSTPYSSRGGCWTPSFGMILAPDGPKRLLTSQKRGWIDTGIYLDDCVEATLFGRTGVLLIHRNAQVRFYEPPELPGERWPYTEIYSIYTPSAQSGLLLEDIDGDGRIDFYCGNYWIRSPDAFELPWRLFAIHPHYKQPLSSSFRLARAFGGIVAAQREFSDQPVFSLFRKPGPPAGDPSQMWEEHPLAPGRKLRKPQALVYIRGHLFVGEDSGPDSRILQLDSPQDPGTVWAKPGQGVIAAFEGPGGQLITVGRREIRIYSVGPPAAVQ